VAIARATDDASISYETSGEGPPLVLVHGITESRRAWDPLLDALASDHRVIAIDLRGHGESERRPPYDALTMADDLHAVINAAGAHDPLLVGHSLGGAVVSLYAAQHSARGVMNIDQAIELGGFKAMLAPIEPMLRGDDAAFQAVMHELADTLYGPLPSEERLRLATLAHPEQQVVLGVWDLVLQSSAQELDALVGAAAAAITAPYLALHGTDPGDEYRAWLTAKVKTATIEVWPDHGHYPHLLEPARFLARLRDFEREC
jgi:pimeloyl-ACP methyl ester carboxylesterase